MKQLLSTLVLVIVLFATMFSQSRKFTTYEVTYFLKDGQVKTVPITLNMRLTDFELTVTDEYNNSIWTFTDDMVYLSPDMFFADARDKNKTPCRVSFEGVLQSETTITIRYPSYRVIYKVYNK